MVFLPSWTGSAGVDPRASVADVDPQPLQMTLSFRGRRMVAMFDGGLQADKPPQRPIDRGIGDKSRHGDILGRGFRSIASTGDA
jgi:hypothetical protein